jgi:hypothetical protein
MCHSPPKVSTGQTADFYLDNTRVLEHDSLTSRWGSLVAERRATVGQVLPTRIMMRDSNQFSVPCASASCNVPKCNSEGIWIHATNAEPITVTCTVTLRLDSICQNFWDHITPICCTSYILWTIAPTAVIRPRARTLPRCAWRSAAQAQADE